VLNKKIALGAILVVGLILRLISSNQSLWLDEATSILTAKNFSFVEITTKFSPGDFHPPLYYLVLKIWIQILGTSEIAARSLSVLFGALTVLVVYQIGSVLHGKFVGLAAALLLAFSPLHIYYSQEARMYSMETFLAALLVWCFTTSRWALFIITGTLLVYTDYLPALIFVPLLWHAIIQKKAKQFLLCSSVIILSLVSWLPTFYQQLQNGLLVKTNAPDWWKVLGKTNLKELALVLVKFIIGRISFYNKPLYAGFVLVGLFLHEIPLRRALVNWDQSKLLWTWLTVPLILAATIGLKVSVFSYFRLLFLLPAFCLLTAYGLTFVEEKYKKLVFCMLLVFSAVCTSIYFSSPRLHRENWKDAVSWIEESANGKNAASIFVTNNQRDPYYYYSRNVVPSYGPNGLEAENFEKIYLMRYVQPIFDPQDNLRKKVEESYKKTREKDFNGVTVWEYEKP